MKFLKQLKIPAIVLIIFLLMSCHEPSPDFKKVEQLTAKGLYTQAEAILKTALTKRYSDTLHYARILNRIKIIRRLRFFKTLDTLTIVGKWAPASTVWKGLYSALQDSTPKTRRFYGFTLFHYKSLIDSALGLKGAYWSALKRGLRFPTVKTALARLKYEKLGLYLAGQDSLEEARAMFDRSLRMLRVTKLNAPFNKVYFSYMEGHFEECLHTLISLPDSTKDNHWKRLQTFLNRYGTKLTLDERFKLW